MSPRYRTSVPATTANLGPGYDILGLALDLHLTATAVPAEEWAFELRGEGSQLLDTCDLNLTARAFKKACERQGWQDQPLRVESDNPIPIARGLGSSAAAIVTGMTLAQLVHQGRLDKDALFRDAAEMEGHPDNVAAAVYGGLQEVVRQDGGYQARAWKVHEAVRILLVIPGDMKSTERLREIVPDELSVEAQSANETALNHVLTGLAEGNPALLRFSEEDQRHQPYRLAVQPTSEAIFALLRKEPAVAGAFLSGAGSTVAAWVAGDEDPTDSVVQTLEKHNLDAAVVRARPDRTGTIGAILSE
jgi:homoserine kinase